MTQPQCYTNLKYIHVQFTDWFKIVKRLVTGSATSKNIDTTAMSHSANLITIYLLIWQEDCFVLHNNIKTLADKLSFINHLLWEYKKQMWGLALWSSERLQVSCSLRGNEERHYYPLPYSGYLFFLGFLWAVAEECKFQRGYKGYMVYFTPQKIQI